MYQIMGLVPKINLRNIRMIKELLFLTNHNIKIKFDVFETEKVLINMIQI